MPLRPLWETRQIIGLAHENDPDTVYACWQILEQAQHIAGWTASFRDMTMGGQPEQIPFSFNGIAREVFQLVRRPL